LRAELGQRIGFGADLLELAFLPVTRLVVGVGVMREPFDLEDDDGRSGRLPDPADDRAEGTVAGQRVASVEPVNGQAVELGRVTARVLVEGVAARVRRDGENSTGSCARTASAMASRNSPC